MFAVRIASVDLLGLRSVAGPDRAVHTDVQRRLRARLAVARYLGTLGINIDIEAA
jgi:hypothetical protein